MLVGATYKQAFMHSSLNGKGAQGLLSSTRLHLSSFCCCPVAAEKSGTCCQARKFSVDCSTTPVPVCVILAVLIPTAGPDGHYCLMICKGMLASLVN